MNFRNLFGTRSGVVLAIVFVFACAGSALAKGKPVQPPGDNPPGNPVIVYQAGYDIWLMDADGNNKILVYTLQAPGPASWCSPDGTDIVFTDVIDGISGVYQLSVVHVDADGKRTVQVGVPRLVAETNHIGLWFARCSPVPIGPDHQIMVAYHDSVYQPDGSYSHENLYLVRLGVAGDPPATPVLILDGLQHGLARGFENGIEITNLSWSPNGDRLVFASVADAEILGIAWDGSGQIQINCCTSLILDVTESPLRNLEDFLTPSWSHDGDHIAIDAFESPNTGSLWIIPVDDPVSAKRVLYDQITDVGRADVGWSPDDNQLIYLRNPRRGMCGEGNTYRVKGYAIGVSNMNLDEIVPIEKDGLLCDEVAIARDGRNPDWWRGGVP